MFIEPEGSRQILPPKQREVLLTQLSVEVRLRRECDKAGDVRVVSKLEW